MKNVILWMLSAGLMLTVVGCSRNKKPDPEVLPGGQPIASKMGPGAQKPGYQRPSGPVPRNPDFNFSADISRASAVTYNSGSRSAPFVAITFDDGPHPQNTPRLLDMLKERNIKATFYVIGKSVEAHPQIIRRMVAEGHEIGNHTWSHPNLTKLSQSAVEQELRKCEAAIAKAAAVRPRTMRPPYGAFTQSQRVWAFDNFGYPTILWDVDPQDWKRPGVSVVANRIVSNTQNGSIILAHDLHKTTVDSMPRALDDLLRKGYKFVTVSQLIAMQTGE